MLAAGAVAAGLSASSGRADAKVVRIASQKGAGTLSILKKRRTLEERLRPLGWSATWAEFPAGPQLLESLNVDGADFGLVGEGPPIFAQAAGADIVYAGTEVASPRAEAIIVPKDSSSKTVADLKGKRVALNKGSNVNYLLVRALEASGLAYHDVQTIYLAPADARAAFERGAVDAWVIWDPYYAATAIDLGARTLADGNGLAGNVSYYMARRQIAEANPQVVEVLLDEIDKVDTWAKTHRAEFAAELSGSLGIPAKVAELWVERLEFGAKSIDATALGEQQKVADAFARIGLIPKRIDVFDASWNRPPRTSPG